MPREYPLSAQHRAPPCPDRSRPQAAPPLAPVTRTPRGELRHRSAATSNRRGYRRAAHHREKTYSLRAVNRIHPKTRSRIRAKSPWPCPLMLGGAALRPPHTSSTSSRSFLDTFVGVTTCTPTLRSPRPEPRNRVIPRPAIVRTSPACTPGRISSVTSPSNAATVQVVPRIASVTETSTWHNRSSPLRLKRS